MLSNDEVLRVVVADDHALVREGISSLINTQPSMEVVGQAENGEEAWLLAREFKPDVIVMDVVMPKVSGAQATQRIVACCPNVRVLAVSIYGDDGHVRQMLTAGASGYLLKKAASRDLIDAIRTLAQNGVYLGSGVAGEIEDNHIKPPSSKAGLAALSSTEIEILRKVAYGYSNKEIAEDLSFSVKTIESYKTRINLKMGFASRVELVEFVRWQGWFNN